MVENYLWIFLVTNSPRAGFARKDLSKGDITMSDGTGTDNMTCIRIFFSDPDEVKIDS